MDVTITIRDPKFNIGDVIFKPNKENDKGIYFHILNISGFGNWEFGSGKAFTTFDYYNYMLVVQEGSYCDSKSLSLIRPGTIVCLNVFEIDSTSNKIDWNKEIIKEDTFSNIIQRQDEWKEHKV